ncbi:drug resistance transporter EmrB/QacA subfamily protein [Coccidioides immitis H538.4]|uniref:Drug resistance transporter EmrB/QacA subfamily protein n=1 Tax=Coccidioides immitis H538.4 TaxID=396776 RepID=A0A0J8RQJ6_COCIT|nr:drug resistance transporter EmrB/QacA subfamily protein [Coccidioides immitis H538.4]
MSRTSTEVRRPASIYRTVSKSTGVILSTSPEQVAGASHNVSRENLTGEISANAPGATQISALKAVIIIATASSMTLMNSLLTGILTVGLPVIAKDIGLAENLLLWPASVYGLACGCTLLLSGSVGDVVGSRPLYLAGCGLLSAFTLGCGLATTGIQLIVFRAISGVALSLSLPSAVCIITTTFQLGKRRNIAFACLGAAQPVGFSLGIVLGGVLIAGIGWRYGYYIVAALNVCILLIAVWQIPNDPRMVSPITLRRLYNEIDWIGTILISLSLGIFSYTLSTMTASIRELVKPVNLSLLILSLVIFVAFIFWIFRQEKLGRVAMVPPSLFKADAASAPAGHATSRPSYFTSLYFQRIQNLSALQASVRFIPMVISGALTNIATGLLVPRVKANVLCIVAAIVSAIAPLLMAAAKPEWSYWTAPFLSVALIPVSADTLFTVSNLVITSAFPAKMHGLAGGVFNTISQIGMSVGLAVTAVAANAVTGDVGAGDEGDRNEMVVEAVLKGYQAAYWMSFAAGAVIVGLSWWGLRGIGRIGLKSD